MNESTLSGVEAIIEEARKPIIENYCGTPFAFIPDGYKRESLEFTLPSPVRKKAKVTIGDTKSFIKYIAKHGDSDTCVIYINTDFVKQTASLTAVINDNGADLKDANWRDHTASFTPTKTVEWDMWSKSSKVPMSQLAFATFIEDNMSDIATVEGMPTGTEMLRMAMDFEANSEKRFKQKLNTTTGGVRLEYIDDEDKDTRSQMSVYERFTLGMRVLLNGDAYQVQARLRYKQKERSLEFWYELIRPDRVFEAALKDEIALIESETGFMILNGSPG